MLDICEGTMLTYLLVAVQVMLVVGTHSGVGVVPAKKNTNIIFLIQIQKYKSLNIYL